MVLRLDVSERELAGSFGGLRKAGRLRQKKEDCLGKLDSCPLFDIGSVVSPRVLEVCSGRYPSNSSISRSSVNESRSVLWWSPSPWLPSFSISRSVVLESDITPHGRGVLGSGVRVSDCFFFFRSQ